MPRDIAYVRPLIRCVYCGAQADPRRRPRVCHAHRDLPRRDPRYTAEQRRTA